MREDIPPACERWLVWLILCCWWRAWRSIRGFVATAALDDSANRSDLLVRVSAVALAR